MMPYKNLRIDIDEVNVYPGEILTVWGNIKDRLDDRDACQIEIRVNKHGIVEVFYNDEYPVVIDTFNHYYQMQKDGE